MDWLRAAGTVLRSPDGQPPVSLSSSRLALREVREIGLPAVFLDFGEALLYLDGQLFSLRDMRAAKGAPGVLPAPLPSQVLDCGVGIEFGWRHLGGCACRFCWGRGEQRAA